jgi:hypothetical protein
MITQDHTGPVWPAAIAVGILIWALATCSGADGATSEMRTPGLLLAAGGAACGIFRLARSLRARPEDSRTGGRSG